MPAAHIAGIPIEETLLSFGGPAALYFLALGSFAAVKRVRARMGARLRQHLRADG